MKKLTVFLAAALFISACGAKVKSPDFLFGSKLYSQFTDYYLKGEARLAEHAFAGSEAQFLKMDAMCNLSRIYIGRYVLDEPGTEPSLLLRAAEFAELGACAEEAESVKYLSGETYDKKLLPEPYSLEAGADAEKLVSLSGDEDLPDYTRTRLMRTAAIAYIVNSPEQAEELAERAIVLDRFNGWSLNILRDLIIIKNARLEQNKETDEIVKRIELLKAVLNKK